MRPSGLGVSGAETRLERSSAARIRWNNACPGISSQPMSVDQGSSEKIRMMRRGKPWAGVFFCALNGIAVVAACGGSEEVVRAPQTTKVVWGNGEGSPDAPAAEEPAAEDSPTEATAAKEEAAPEPAAKPAPKPKEPVAAPRAGDDSEEAAALAAGAIDLDAPPPAPPRADDKAAPKAGGKKGRAKKERATKERATKVAEAPVVDEKDAPAPEPPRAEPSPDAPPPLAELQRRRNQREKEEAKDKPEPPAKGESEPAPAPVAYKGAEPCRAESFTIARVRIACENGGRPGAKRVMKEAINKAVATGKLLKCADCHSSTTDYALKSDAVDKLQSWLGE